MIWRVTQPGMVAVLTALELFERRLPRAASICHIGAGAVGEQEYFTGHGHSLLGFDHGIGGPLWPPQVLMRMGSADGVYCSHTLEHMPDPGEALRAMHYVLKPGGIVGIVVPPLKTQLVGGHLTLWTAGLLAYNMILAGFDLRNASVRTWDYNIAIVAERQVADFRLAELRHDNGDINTLARFFPWPVHDGIDGRLPDTRWE